MALTTRTKRTDVSLNDLEARRIQRHVQDLERRLAGWPDPVATLQLAGRPAPRGVEARLRVRLGHLGGHLVARETAETADHAVRQVVEQVVRQLARERARRNRRDQPWPVQAP
jgi:ribosome-associated translation inhibitor RaiA